MEQVAISCSRGSSWHKGQTCVSCFGRQVLYSWATWERNCQAAFNTAVSFCFSFIPHACQHLVVSVFQILAILIGVQWYLIVSVCISLMTRCEAYFHMLICHLYIIWRREGQPPAVFLPGESQGQRSLVGYSPWGCKELDRTEWLTHTDTHTHTHTHHIWWGLEFFGPFFSWPVCFFTAEFRNILCIFLATSLLSDTSFTNIFSQRCNIFVCVCVLLGYITKL